MLGIVQGLTGFLPISSTVHLKATLVLPGWGDPGVAVTTVLQLGSIVAVIACFRKDLRQPSLGLLQGLRQGNLNAPEARLGLAIAAGTVPRSCGWPHHSSVLPWGIDAAQLGGIRVREVALE